MNDPNQLIEMFCLQSRRGSNGEVYERLPLLPKYVVRVRQYGNNVALTIDDIDRRFDKVTWERNGAKIETNNQKFHIIVDLPNVVSLVIHDVTVNDSATYQCILKSGKFCPIKLVGPAFQVRTELTRAQIRSRLTHQPILSTNWRSRNSSNMTLLAELKQQKISIKILSVRPQKQPSPELYTTASS
ncbi:uncharacterized protein LOC134264786 isoform X2 [Saccostrea cucullata]|uniref:uncharacterized protein LOC134264786 isoform X2 n=1 Tax=Saccostrea cuccullata TaxID=36930 RepID=UPI002ED18C9D